MCPPSMSFQCIIIMYVSCFLPRGLCHINHLCFTLSLILLKEMVARINNYTMLFSQELRMKDVIRLR